MSAGWLLLLVLLAEPPTAHRATLFLDFDGGPVGPGSLSPYGEAPCIQSPFEYPAYFGTEEDRATVTEEARRLLDPFGIAVTDEEPPPELPYTRVMLGGEAEGLGLDPTLNGLSCVLDCGDSWWRDTVMVFSDRLPPLAAGRTAVHEAGHAWGLEHVENETDLMGEWNDNAEGFVEACVPLSAGAGSDCAEVHELFCASGEQNSHAALLAMFGPNTPDTEPPQVTILSPEDGTHVQPGTELLVEVEITDDFGGVGWKFVVPEEDWEHIAFEGETSLVLPFPEGEFTIVVEAIDHGRNVGQDSVSVRVDWDADPTGTDTDETTDTGSDTSDDQAADAPAASCACGSGGGVAPWPWSLWLAVCLPLRRRGPTRPRTRSRRLTHAVGERWPGSSEQPLGTLLVGSSSPAA